MSGTMQRKQVSGHPMLAGGGSNAVGRASPWSRDGLFHPTALPLGLVIGGCLGVLTAVIMFF